MMMMMMMMIMMTIMVMTVIINEEMILMIIQLTLEWGAKKARRMIPNDEFCKRKSGTFVPSPENQTIHFIFYRVGSLCFTSNHCLTGYILCILRSP